MYILVPFIAFILNTLYPASGLSNALLLLFCLYIGNDFFEDYVFLRVTLISFLVFVICAYSGLHGVSSRDISAALSLSLILAAMAGAINTSGLQYARIRKLRLSITLLYYFAVSTLVLEYILALAQNLYGYISSIPRASAPLRFDSFLFDIPYGVSIDPNNLGVFLLLLAIGIWPLANRNVLAVLMTLTVVGTGSRTSGILTMFWLAIKNYKFVFFLLSVLIFGLLIVGIDPVSPYLGRFDTTGSIEGSFVDRAQRIHDVYELIGFLPIDDEKWSFVENGVQHTSSYNGYLNIQLRFGAIGLFYFSLMTIFTLVKSFRSIYLVLALFLSSLTGEYFYNCFVVYSFLVSLILTRTYNVSYKPKV